MYLLDLETVELKKEIVSLTQDKLLFKKQKNVVESF